ncbi:MAG: hypothetical protein R2838_15055 [Caldilineaceae bacterium]
MALRSLPFGTWYDEANHALQAMRILSSADYRPIFDGTTNGPAHYTYPGCAGPVRHGAVGPGGARRERLPGRAHCTGGLPAGPRTLRCTQRAGAGRALAVSSWSITFSRLGMFATMSTPLCPAHRRLPAAGPAHPALHRLRLDRRLAGAGPQLLHLVSPLCLSGRSFLAYYIIVQWLWRRERLPARFGSDWSSGLAALAVAAAAPLAQKHPDLFWARVQDTFIFADKTPDQRWPALWENVRKHVFMFNWPAIPTAATTCPARFHARPHRCRAAGAGAGTGPLALA